MVQLLGNRDVAFVGIFLAHDHAEERGLAGAVGTDQPDLLAGVQLKRSVDEDQLLAVLLVDIGKRNHYSIISDSFSTVAQFLAVQVVESFESK